MKRYKSQKKQYEQRCNILGRGEIIGYDDVVTQNFQNSSLNPNPTYSKTLKCKVAGEMLVMSAKEFHMRIKNNKNAR